MTRKLDFIVFGMPRGGTSAVGRYLSAVDALHCGQEVFPISLDHSKLDIPDAFLTRQHDNWNDSSVDDITARRDQIRYYGNKTPMYFYRLNDVRSELDDCPAIACVRNPRSVALSYSTRATNDSDRWHPGRRGLYAAGDAIMLAHALLSTPEGAQIMVIPQQSLLVDWHAVMSQAVTLIAPEIKVDFNAAKLDEIEQIKKRQTSRKKVDLVPAEEAALKRIENTGLFALYDRDTPYMVDEVRDELAEIVEKLPPNPLNFIKRQSENLPDAVARDFYDRWQNPARRAWKRLRPQAAAQN